MKNNIVLPMIICFVIIFFVFCNIDFIKISINLNKTIDCYFAFFENDIEAIITFCVFISMMISVSYIIIILVKKGR